MKEGVNEETKKMRKMNEMRKKEK